MKIADVSVGVHRFDTRLPVVDKPGPSETRVIVTVRTDEGHAGVGMTARFLTAAVATAIETHLGPAIVGLDPLRREAVHARLWPLVSERGVTNGVNRGALSAIDLALWDIAGQAHGARVSDLLGGLRDEAEAYVTFGFPSLDREELAALASAMADEGFGTLKMVVAGKAGLGEDAARVRAVIAAVEGRARVAIDANEGLSGDEALRLVTMLDGEDIAWFEDPVWNNDARDLARLRTMTRIPVGAGQMDGHVRRFREYAAADAIDIFMPNSLYNGGMTETQRVAALALAHERPLSDAGGGGIYCLHHMTAFPGTTLAEVHLGTLDLERQLFGTAAPMAGGRVRLPDGPGFGLVPDPAALAATRIG